MKIDINGAGSHHGGAHALNDQPRLHLAMQAGLRRPGLASDWSAVSSAARVVMNVDGRAIRNPITGRRAQPTGIYVGRKPGRALVHESMNEHAFLQHSEVDTSVIDYLSQPCRFEFVMDGVKRAYIADCARFLANGRIEIVEVKSDGRWARDPDYAAKLNYVEAICKAVGWSFRVAHGGHCVSAPPATSMSVSSSSIGSRALAAVKSSGFKSCWDRATTEECLSGGYWRSLATH
jgi:hypothetical protein